MHCRKYDEELAGNAFVLRAEYALVIEAVNKLFESSG